MKGKAFALVLVVALLALSGPAQAFQVNSADAWQTFPWEDLIIYLNIFLRGGAVKEAKFRFLNVTDQAWINNMTVNNVTVNNINTTNIVADSIYAVHINTTSLNVTSINGVWFNGTYLNVTWANITNITAGTVDAGYGIFDYGYFSSRIGIGGGGIPPECSLDLGAGSICNVFGITSGTGTSQPLRLHGTGSIIYVGDSDDDQGPVSHSWFFNSEATANTAMELEEPGNLWVAESVNTTWLNVSNITGGNTNIGISANVNLQGNDLTTTGTASISRGEFFSYVNTTALVAATASLTTLVTTPWLLMPHPTLDDFAIGSDANGWVIDFEEGNSGTNQLAIRPGSSLETIAVFDGNGNNVSFGIGREFVIDAGGNLVTTASINGSDLTMTGDASVDDATIRGKLGVGTAFVSTQLGTFSYTSTSANQNNYLFRKSFTDSGITTSTQTDWGDQLTLAISGDQTSVMGPTTKTVYGRLLDFNPSFDITAAAGPTFTNLYGDDLDLTYSGNDGGSGTFRIYGRRTNVAGAIQTLTEYNKFGHRITVSDAAKINYALYLTATGADTNYAIRTTGGDIYQTGGNLITTGDITTTGNITADWGKFRVINVSYTGKSANVYYNVTKEIEINPSRFKLPGLNPPGESIINNFPVLSFDKNTNESAYATMHVIPEYREGSNWDIAFYWAPEDADAGTVVWCVNVTKVRRENNEVITNPGTNQCVDDATQTLQYELLKTTKITIDGSGYLEDDGVAFRIHRGADMASDTYDDDAHLVEATIYYNAHKLGD